MEITFVTSFYDYTDGILLIADWITETCKKLDIKYDVIFYNDDERNINKKEFKTVSTYTDFRIIHVEKNTGDLRIPYKLAAENALKKNHYAVCIIESDAVPNAEVLDKMLDVYKNPFKKPLASVSPMYTWNNVFCYPTHSHWFTDGLNTQNGRYTDNRVGTVSDVGAPGVPFVFSLWNPVVLDMINDSLPKIVSLDQRLGLLSHEKGYHHLRLINSSIEHINSGKRSWKSNGLNQKKSLPLKKIVNVDSENSIKIIQKPKSMLPPRKIIHYTGAGVAIRGVVREQVRLISDIENNILNKIGTIQKIILPEKKIAVVLHLYYIDLWNEILGYLSNMYTKFDLYVTMVEGSTSYKELLNKKKIILNTYPTAKIFILDNRGLDIGSFLYIVNYLISSDITYDYIIKLHTKKSLHSSTPEAGNAWRTELYNSILGSNFITNGIARILNLNFNIGMVGSKKWYINTKEKRSLAFGKNFFIIRNLMTKFNLQINIEELEFIGGTMFWADYETLIKPFRNIDISKFRNELEFGSLTDHVKASTTHSMERIFGLMVSNNNKRVFSV